MPLEVGAGASLGNKRKIWLGVLPGGQEMLRARQSRFAAARMPSWLNPRI